jgi:hypothetical protein
MKSFAEFLMESKKQYAFRVKLACECTNEQMAALKTALDKYRLSAISEPKETPIAETHRGFEHLKNVKVSIIDVMVDYPANPVQIREMVRDSMNIAESHIMVLSPGEEANALPVAPINKGKALLDTPELSPPDPKAQDEVGLKKLASLLKELNKDKHGGIQYKGVNDEIQAKSPYKEKPAKFNTDLPVGDKSPMGNRKQSNLRTGR